MTLHRYSPPGRGSSVADMPIQRVAFSGSTKNCQTVSGRAAIASSRSTAVVSVVASMLLLLSFRFALERLEALVPEPLEELPQLSEPLGPGPVQPPRAVASLAHEPRLLEDVQMLGDRRPRDVEVRRDLARRELAVPDERKDPPPPGRRDRSQGCLHGQ